MSSKACTPDNVLGEKLGLRDVAGNLDVPPELVDSLDNGGKATFFNVKDQNGAEIYDASPGLHGNPVNQKTIGGLKGWLDDFISPAKNIVRDFSKAEAILPESLVDELDNLLVDFRTRHGGTDFTARRAFNDSIKDYLDSVDTTEMSPAQQRYFERYKRFYGDFDQVFGHQQKGYIEERLDTTTKGVLLLNTSIIAGNPIEVAMKLPALYGAKALAGLAEAGRQGLFRKLPELERQGVYGYEYAGDVSKHFFEKVMTGAEVPFRNISYFTGLAAEGTEAGGRKAIEKILFVPRMANLPMAYHTPMGRATLRLLGYTLNTYKMLGGMAKGLANPETFGKSALGLTYYGALGYMLGGASGVIPTPLTQLIGLVSPETRDAIEGDRRPLTGLMQVSGINRVGIPLDILNRNLKTLNQAMNGEEVPPEDVAFAASALLFNSDLMNNKLIQRAVHQGLQVYREEEDLPTATQKVLAPFSIER